MSDDLEANLKVLKLSIGFVSLTLLGNAGAAQAADSSITSIEHLRRSVQAADGYLRGGDLPAILRRRDSEGRETDIVTESGSKVADIHVNGSGHADSVTLSNGLKLSVMPAGKKAYRQVLSGSNGKPLFDHSVDTTTRRRPDEVFLAPVASDLGLTSNWRHEITVEHTGSSLTVRDLTGKTILYVVRSGADKVGFTPDGRALFYDVMADIYAGRTTDSAEWENLQTLIPDHFVYVRDGRIGAYVATAATSGISAFWTERDTTGNIVVRFDSGTSRSASASTRSLIPAATAPFRLPRHVGPQDFCVISYTTTDYGDGTSSTVITDVECFYFGTGGGGGGNSSGGAGGAIGSFPSNATTGILKGKVDAGLQNAATKLTNQQCAALLDTFKNQSGQTLRAIMNQRSFSDPGAYLSGGMGFYDGQTHRDAQGNVPCSYGYAAWTVPGITQTWVCDPYASLTTGMAGVIAIHEMLHSLGLQEGGQGQMTSDQITTAVSNACGTS